MSSSTTQTQNDNFAHIDYDTSKTFIWNNRYDRATFKNDTGGEVTIKPGALLGRIASTNQLVQHDATGTDGRQFPVGVAAEEITVADTNTADLTYCIMGDVVEPHLIQIGSQALDTVIGGGTTAQEYHRTVRDAVQGQGIRLVASIEATQPDNA